MKRCPLASATVTLCGNVIFPSEDELRTTLIIFTDLSYETGTGSRKINIEHLDLFPESGIK